MEAVWKEDLHILLYSCFQQGISSSSLLLDLDDLSVEEYPPIGDFQFDDFWYYHAFSPDRTKVLFGSGGNWVGNYSSDSPFVLLDLSSKQVFPFYEPIISKDFYWLDTP
jgi:hypothetical protein